MRLRFWKKKPTWENLGTHTYTVGPGRHTATYSVTLSKGKVNSTIVVVPTIEKIT